MFLKLLVLNLILGLSALAVDSGYYTNSSIGGSEVYFPKSDTEYIDYLTKQDNTEAHYELAIAHLKFGKKDIAERYIEQYKAEEQDLNRIVKYYRLAGNYKMVEGYLDTLLEESDTETQIKYKLLILEEIERNNTPLDKEKYSVSKVEKLYYYRDEEKKFKEYFNSEKWTKGEMGELAEMLKTESLLRGSSPEKLFELFADDRGKAQKEYLKIRDLGDINGYNSYFTFTSKKGLEPEIRNEIEGLYYLRYRNLYEEAKEYQEKLAVKYLKDEDTDKLKVLYKVYKTDEIKNYLQTRDEETAYSIFIEDKTPDQGKIFLKNFPEGRYAQKVYTEVFNQTPEPEKQSLITTYDRGYRVSEGYLLKSYSEEERSEFFRRRIVRGEIEYLDDYIKLLERRGDVSIENAVKDISREAYAAYLIDQRRTLPESERELGANYLYEKNDIKRLMEYIDYLPKEKLSKLSKKDSNIRTYYQEKYPLEKDNIDATRMEYFYFNSRPDTDRLIVEDLINKRHLEPQERYYLAIYYYNKGDYTRSYRESEQLYRRYQLSDKIFKLHSDNIKKIKGSTV